MANKDGSLEFTAILNNGQLLAAVNESERRIKNFSQNTLRETSLIDKAFEGVSNNIGNVLTFTGAAMAVKEIATVRGEFQQLEIAFSTMLQSKDRADKLMQQMVELAATTPFNLQDVATGAKQLLAYGSSAESVSSELKMLGNIASGLSIPLGDLVYLYGTTRQQGRLFTQDMRQFTGRGIDLTTEFAKQFRVAKEKVSELVTAGKIGFPEVEKALKSMTSEGGKFYDLMDEQSKAITGKISNLKDSISIMFNEIGKSSQGAISDVISGASYIVAHYKQIGTILTGLIGTYGTYKTILMVVSAVQKLNVAVLRQAVLEKKLAALASIELSNAEAVEAARTKMLTLAKANLLNVMNKISAATLENPYLIAAAAIAVFAVSMYKISKATTGAEKALADYNKELGETTQKQDELKEKTNGLLEKIQDETLTRRVRYKAYTDLQALYPAIFKNMSYENFLLSNKVTLLKLINKENDKDTERKLRAQIENYKKLLAEEKKRLDIQKDASQSKGGASTAYAGYAISISPSGKDVNKINEYKKSIELAENALAEFLKEKKKAEEEEKAGSTTTLIEVIGKIKAEQIKINEMRKQAQSGTVSTEDIKGEEDVLKALKEQYQLMTGEEYGKKTKTKTTDPKSSAEFKAFENNLSIELEKQKTTLDALKYLEEEKKKITGNTSEDKAKIELISDKEREQTAKFNSEADALIKSYSDFNQKKLDAEAQYEYNMDVLQKKFIATTDINDKARIANAIRLYEKLHELGFKSVEDFEDTYAESVKNLGTFEQKKLFIVQEYDKQIKAAQAKGDEDLVTALTKKKNEEISNLAEDVLKSTTAISKLFSSTSNLNRIAKNGLIKQLQALVDFLSSNDKNKKWDNSIFQIDEKVLAQLQASPELVEKLKAELNDLRQENQGKSALQSLIDGVNELKEAKKNLNIEGIEEATKKIKENLGSAAVEVAASANVLSQTFEMFGMSDVGQITSQIENLYTTINETGADSASSITSIIGLILSVIKELVYSSSGLDMSLTMYSVTMDNLSYEYSKLSKLMQSGTYQSAAALQETIANLEEQKDAIAAAGDAYETESSEKDYDPATANQYVIAWNEADDKIDQAKETFANLFTDFDSLAGDLSNSLVQAFINGESAAEAWKNTVNDAIVEIITNAFKMNVISKYLQPAIDFMEDALQDGILSEDELNNFLTLIDTAKTSIDAAWPMYEQLIKPLNLSSDSSNSLSGSIKSITAEQAGVLEGQVNAMRINQIQANDLLRSQLLVQYEIRDSNNIIADKINKIHNILNNGSSERAWG